MKAIPLDYKHWLIVEPMLARLWQDKAWFENLVVLNQLSAQPLNLLFTADDGTPWGYLAVLVDANDTAVLEGGVMPDLAKPWQWARILKLYMEFLFSHGVHKVMATVAIEPGITPPSELLLRGVGFRKEGLFKGKRKTDTGYGDELVFGLLKNWLKTSIDLKLELRGLRKPHERRTKNQHA